VATTRVIQRPSIWRSRLQAVPPIDAKGLRIGIPNEYFIEGMDPDVEKAILGAIDQFKRLGAEVQRISLPHTEYAVAVLLHHLYG